MKALGLDADLSKYDQDQPRVPAGSGRESGRWTSGGGGATAVPQDIRAHLVTAGPNWERVRALIQLLVQAGRRFFSEGKPTGEVSAEHEGAPALITKPQDQAPTPSKPSDFVGEDFGQLGTGVEKPAIGIREFDPHAIERITQRGVSSQDLESTVAEPLIVLQQTEDKFLFLSDKAGVVVTKDGKVITTYPKSKFDSKILDVLDRVHQGERR